MSGQALRELVLGIMREQAVEIHQHVVSAVNGDGTVTLGSGDAAIPNVPCSSAYPIRANGDKVLVFKTGPSWSVFAKSETTPADGTVTLANLYEAIDNLHAQILREIPTSIKLQYGSGGVPSGFSSVSSFGVRDDGSGNFTLYLGGVSGSPSTRPASSVRPSGKIVTTTGLGSWSADGSTDETAVQQGGAQQWTGAWFYGSKISDAVGKGTISAMTVSVTRTNNGTGTVPLRGYLHSSSSSGPVELIAGPSTPFSIGPGETRTWNLPTVWAQRLADPNDPAKGIAIYSGAANEYAAFTTNSGTITITFSSPTKPRTGEQSILCKPGG